MIPGQDHEAQGIRPKAKEPGDLPHHSLSLMPCALRLEPYALSLTPYASRLGPYAYKL